MQGAPRSQELRLSAACLVAQVDRLGEGSQLHTDAMEIRSAAEASWQGLQPVLADGAAAYAFGGRRPARTDFQWAFSMLLSRLIRLPVGSLAPRG